MKTLGKVNGEKVKSKLMPPWEECWCGKGEASGGCRFCQTYQLFWGLDPTCGDKGLPEKEYWSMGRRHIRTDDELREMLEQQTTMRTKYRS